MAAASDIPIHYPIPTPCDLCEENEDVNSYCKECHQYVCDRCKRLHARNPYLRNHTLVSYTEGYKIHRDHNALCPDHNEMFSVFCRTCNRHICTKCLTSENHKSHKFSDINDYADEVTSRIKQKMAEIAARNGHLIIQMATVKNKNSKVTMQCDEDINKIRENVAAVIEEARKTETEMTEAIRKRKEEICQNDKKMADDINSSVRNNKIQLTEIDENLQRQSSISVVSFENQAISLLQGIKIPSTPTPESISDIRFVPGKLNIHTVRDIIGHVGTAGLSNKHAKPNANAKISADTPVKFRSNLAVIMVKPTEILDHGYWNTASLLPIPRVCKVWSVDVLSTDVICAGVENTGFQNTFGPSYKIVKLDDNANNQALTVLTDRLWYCPHHLCATANGFILFSSHCNIIQQVSLATTPMVPRQCIRFAQIDGEAGSMALYEDNSVFVAVKNRQAQPTIHRFSIDGLLIQKLDFVSAIRDCNKACIPEIKPYIDGQFLVKFNNVVNTLNNKSELGGLCCLDELWRVHCITSDTFGNVICANRNGNVFVINKTGQLIQQYQLHSREIVSITVDSMNRLWIGSGDGNVILASYILTPRTSGVVCVDPLCSPSQSNP